MLTQWQLGPLRLDIFLVSKMLYSKLQRKKALAEAQKVENFHVDS